MIVVIHTWHRVKKVYNVWKTFVITMVNVLFISAINYLPKVCWVYFRNLRINKDEHLGEKKSDNYQMYFDKI